MQLQATLTQLIYERALLTRTGSEGASSSSDPSSSGTSTDPTKDFAGRLHNLISSDIDNIVFARDPVLLLVLFGPLKTVLSTFFLYRLLGPR